MKKLGIWAIAIASAFVIGVLSANPVVEAVGGWQQAIANLQLDVITVDGNLIDLNFGGTNQDTSIASCPVTHKVIGGGLRNFDIKVSSGGGGQKVDYEITQETDFANNAYKADATLKDQADRFLLRAYANCARIVT